MKGTKRSRSGAWRRKVFAGWDPGTGKRVDLYETVKAPNNRAGAKAADTRLAEMVAAVESGERPRGATDRSVHQSDRESAKRPSDVEK